MTVLQNGFVLMTTYAKYECEAEYELYKNDPETPVAVLAIDLDFLDHYLETETDYESLEDFFNNYIYDDIEDLQDRAEAASALAFAYRPGMDPLYQFPAVMTREMAQALVDFTENFSLFDRLKNNLSADVKQPYAEFGDGILTPSFDAAAILTDFLCAAGESVMAAPTSDEPNARGIVNWSDRVKEEVAIPDCWKRVVSALEELDLSRFPIRYLAGSTQNPLDMDIVTYDYANFRDAWSAFASWAMSVPCAVLYGQTEDGGDIPLFIGGVGPGLRTEGDYVGHSLFDTADTGFEADAGLAAWLLALSYKANTELFREGPYSNFVTVLSMEHSMSKKLSVALERELDDDGNPSKGPFQFHFHAFNELVDSVHELTVISDLSITSMAATIQNIIVQDKDNAKSAYDARKAKEAEEHDRLAETLRNTTIIINYILSSGKDEVEAQITLPMSSDKVCDILTSQGESQYVKNTGDQVSLVQQILNNLATLQGFQTARFSNAEETLPF